MSEIERPEYEPIKILTIDEKPFAVDSMSKEIQQVIGIFDRWNKEEANIQHEINILGDRVAQLRAAKETVSRQILEMVRKEREAAASADTDPNGGEEAASEDGE